MYDIRVLSWVGGLIVAFAAVLGAVRFAGRSPAETAAEAAVSSVALAAVIAAPGVLTLLARRQGRASLLLPVGIALIPLSFLSFAGVLLPLLIPAVVVLVVYGRRSAVEPPPLVPAAVSAVVVLLFLVVAVMALFAHEDPRSYSTPTESGGTSDVVTYAEALVSIALVATGIGVGWALSRPRTDQPAPG